jgi:hypothetical protein
VGGGSGKGYKSYFAIAQSCSVYFYLHCMLHACIQRSVVGHDTWYEKSTGWSFRMGRPENSNLELLSSLERMSNCM